VVEMMIIQKHKTRLGMIIVTLQCTGMACLIVFQQPVVRKYMSVYVTMLYYSVATAFTCLFCICWFFRFTGPDFYFDGRTLPWVALIYVCFVATLFCYNALSWSCTKVAPSTTTIYNTLQPIGTAILVLLIFGQSPTKSEYVGGLLVACGLLITVRAKMYDNEKDDSSIDSGEKNLIDKNDVNVMSDIEAQPTTTTADTDSEKVNPSMSGLSMVGNPLITAAAPTPNDSAHHHHTSSGGVQTGGITSRTSSIGAAADIKNHLIISDLGAVVLHSRNNSMCHSRTNSIQRSRDNSVTTQVTGLKI